MQCEVSELSSIDSVCTFDGANNSYAGLVL